jgi:hypothetical protein
MWIATVITMHGLTQFAWWLRLRWQAQQEHAHRQDLITLARALPDGGQIHERHSDGTWTRLAVSRTGDDNDRDHG